MLNNVSIANPTLSGGSISGTNVSASGLSVSGNTALGTTHVDGNFSVSGGLSFSSTSTVLSSSNVSFTNSTTTNLAFENATGTNASTTNLTTTNFWYTNASGTVATTTNLFFVNAYGTNATSTNFAFTTGTGTSLTLGTLVFTNASGTYATSTNIAFTNASGTNATALNLSASYASITEATSSYINVGTLTGAGLVSCSGFADKLLYSTATNQFTCGTDQTTVGGGGGSDSNWLWFNGTAIRPATTSNQVLIGGNGTSSPSKLQVIGGATFDNASSTFFETVRASSTRLSVFANAYFGGTATTTIDSAGNLSVAGTSLHTGLASFGNASSSRFSVFDNAYFGGTATTTIDSTGAITVTSSSKSTFPYASTTALTVSGAAYFPGSGIWNAIGYVGIGTTTPHAQLVIADAAAPTLSLWRTGFTSGRVELAAGSAGATLNSFGTLGFGSGSSANALYIQNTGRVGINTTANDVNRLGVSGNVGIGTSFATTQAPSNGLIVEGSIGVGTSTPWGKLSVIATDNASVPQFVVASSSAASFVVAASGNVGIGTGSPSYTLDINSSQTSVLNLQSTTGQVNLGLKNWVVYSGGSNNLSFYTSGTDRLTMLSSGSIGVGTSSPFGKFALSLNSGESYTGNNAFIISSSTASATTTLFAVDNAGKVQIGTTANPGVGLYVSSGDIRTTGNLQVNNSLLSLGGDLQLIGTSNVTFRNATNGELGRFTSGGFLGIGTTSPWKMLSVAGDIIGTNITATGTLAVSGNASFSNATSTNFAITNVANALLATNQSGTVVSTTSISTGLLTGTLGTINGTSLSSGGSITITAASSTLLDNSNTFSGVNTFTGNTTLTNATSTNFFATSASSTNLFSSTASFGTLAASLINFTTLNVSGLSTFANGFVSQASSTVVGNFTSTGIVTGSSFSGAGTGLTGSAASLSIGGNAGTASALQTARTINGTSFNGTADITITAASSSLLTDRNAWSALQLFTSGASSSKLSIFDTTYFGGTATTTIDSAGNLSVAGTSLHTGLASFGNASSSRLSIFNNAYFGGSATTTIDSTGAITVTSNTKSTFPYASTTALTVSSTAYFAGSSVWNANGSVGIGTTSPETKLDVYNTSSGATADQLYLTNAASATSTASRMSFRTIDVLGAGTTTAAIASVLQQNYTTGKGDLVFSTLQSGALTEVFRATSAGNLGVGTTTPFRKFSVAQQTASAQFALAYDTTRSAELKVDSTGDLHIEPSGSDIYLNNDNFWICTGGSISTGGCPSGTPTGAGNLIVESSAGIGTTTPAYKLTIETQDSSTNFFQIASSSAQSVFVVNAAGRIGVGTSSPFAKLAIGAGGAITTVENTLTDGATIAINWLDGNQQKVVLGGNRTITFSNYIAGQILRLVVCQDATGARTITWPSSIRWQGGSAPTLTTTANQCDLTTFIATNATSSLVIFGAAALTF